MLGVPFVAIGSVVANLLHMPVHYCAALLALVLQSLIVAVTVSVVAATAGVTAGKRRRPLETGAIVLICLAYLGVYGCWTEWEGEWSWGPRFLLPVLGVLSPFLELLTGRLRELALALGVLGFLVSAPTWICYYEGVYAAQAEQRIPATSIAWSVSQSPFVRV